MLLVHQTGTVKVGEVVRYTLSYTPSQDRIVPTPPHLFVKVRNVCAVALRAAYLHGPYTLYAACYPSSFDPNESHGSPEMYGYPQFEPNLKAGGAWTSQLKISEDIREKFDAADKRRHSAQAGGSATWVIEISSQVLFSTGAGVHYEILVGRDEKSIDVGFAGIGGVSHTSPGVLSEFQERRKDVRAGVTQPKGVYTKAIHLAITDTAALWNTPSLPGDGKKGQEKKNPVLDDPDPTATPHKHEDELDSGKLESPKQTKKPDKQKIHLVLITHGLHSNLGADMLYMKESIDTAARQARLDRSMRKAKRGAQKASEARQKAEQSSNDPSSASAEPAASIEDDEFDDDGDEQVIVRGFPGNAIRTERGIQYLGKRLAKYVLAMTYPDQPYIPVKKKSMTRTFTNALSGGGDKDKSATTATTGQESHHHSTIRKEPVEETSLAYQITSISFIGHSLGGLVQTYAIAYIQKHSPEFFDLIKPINFIALASPFLGLSNENPLYVKFALDFGLVGRTGQDLGLTWRAPTMVRSGWGAMIAGIGTEGQRQRSQMQPGSKPLLRILPSGPAHQVLRRFRNRTVYSNVVNDGIVPLRTSCLLFLDWYGLERVDKARRENGLVGTMAGWGWAEIMGQNSSEQHQSTQRAVVETDDSSAEQAHSNLPELPTSAKVPQPSADAISDHANVSAPSSPIEERRISLRRKRSTEEGGTLKHTRSNSETGSSPFSGFLNMIRPSRSRSKSKSPQRDLKNKDSRIYKRSQTLKMDDESSTPSGSRDGTMDEHSEPRPGMARGESILQDQNVVAPPKTSVFESAGDILNPPLPTQEYLTNPMSRARTIFHDRVYHPEDIPQPATRARSFFRRNEGQTQGSAQAGLNSVDSFSSTTSSGGTTTSHMKVEEKIARAYHRDLSWRKVLVRLEPDAHNNIVVRRMFANAYGWPVVKHLVDTHFADTPAAKLPDTEEEGVERAKPMHASVADGGEVRQPKRRESQPASQAQRPPVFGSGVVFEGSTNATESQDDVSELPKDMTSSYHSTNTTSSSARLQLSRQDSAQWDDHFFETDDDDDDDEAFEAARSPRHIAMEEASRLVGSKPSGSRAGGDGAGGNPGTGVGKHGGDGAGAGTTGTDTAKDKKDGSGLYLDTTKPSILPNFSQSPVAATTTNEVGLGHSIEEQIARNEQASPRK